MVGYVEIRQNNQSRRMYCCNWCGRKHQQGQECPEWRQEQEELQEHAKMQELLKVFQDRPDYPCKLCRRNHATRNCSDYGDYLQLIRIWEDVFQRCGCKACMARYPKRITRKGSPKKMPPKKEDTLRKEEMPLIYSEDTPASIDTKFSPIPIPIHETPDHEEQEETLLIDLEDELTLLIEKEEMLSIDQEIPIGLQMPLIDQKYVLIDLEDTSTPTPLIKTETPIKAIDDLLGLEFPIYKTPNCEEQEDELSEEDLEEIINTYLEEECTEKVQEIYDDGMARLEEITDEKPLEGLPDLDDDKHDPTDTQINSDNNSGAAGERYDSTIRKIRKRRKPGRPRRILHELKDENAQFDGGGERTRQ